MTVMLPDYGRKTCPNANGILYGICIAGGVTGRPWRSRATVLSSIARGSIPAHSDYVRMSCRSQFCSLPSSFIHIFVDCYRAKITALNLYRVCIGIARKIEYRRLDGEPYGQLDFSVAIPAYTAQIYFDFSGYSDIAIGVSGLLGFRTPENFDRPYRAPNISVFLAPPAHVAAGAGPLSTALTFGFVMAGWVVFASGSLATARDAAEGALAFLGR